MLEIARAGGLKADLTPDAAAQDLPLLCKIALNLARANTTLKASFKDKRKCAAWNDTFMPTLIAG